MTRLSITLTALLCALPLACATASPPSPPRPKPAPPPAPRPSATEAPAAPPPAPLTGLAPCAEGSPDHEAAREKYKGIRLAMKQRKGAAFGEVVPLIKELLASPCYLWVALEPPIQLDFGSPEALVQWWEDGGGEWLNSYLSMPKDETQSRKYIPFQVLVGADMRTVLDAKAAASPAAAPERRALSWLICPDSDPDCGKATSGWAARADKTFEAIGYRNALYGGRRVEILKDEPPSEESCGRAALKAPPNERFRIYRGCIDVLHPRRWAMPLGRFKTPDSGWIVLHGRRGHYEFCDETHAYDLATGAAYVARSCSGLMFGNDGMVDDSQVNAKRRAKVTMGNVSVDNLRELAFMMLLAPEVNRDLVLDPHYIDVPQGIAPVFSEGPRLERYRSDEWRGSWQTALSWGLFKGSALINSGRFTWPGSWNAAEEHIDGLLVVAESGMVKGCPAAALPKGLPLHATPAEVSPIDASEDSVNTTEQDLAAALRGAKLPAGCKPAAAGRR